MAQDTQELVRRRVLSLLLEKVSGDNYPSSTMLDAIEQLLAPDDVETYIDVLMDKLEGENHPSNSILMRMMALG